MPGMCFYDAELLRLRPQTDGDAAARQVEINRALELGRRQTATLFELRAALDDFKLRGNAASDAVADAANRSTANGAWPELAQAKAALSCRNESVGAELPRRRRHRRLVRVRAGARDEARSPRDVVLTSTPSSVRARGYNWYKERRDIELADHSRLGGKPGRATKGNR
jgi:hypothetical protein